MEGIGSRETWLVEFAVDFGLVVVPTTPGFSLAVETSGFFADGVDEIFGHGEVVSGDEKLWCDDGTED